MRPPLAWESPANVAEFLAQAGDKPPRYGLLTVIAMKIARE